MSPVITPPYLTAGDKVAIVAPARKVSPAEMDPAIRLFRSWGLEVVTGPHLFGEEHQYSGSDQERLDDLQMMLDDDSVRAVFAARGGYGTARIVDRLDFSRFCSHPKWIVGFSDITVLHSHIHSRFGIETLHAAMPFTFPSDGKVTESIASLKRALFGEMLEYSIPGEQFNRGGSGRGLLVGGNLSILYAMNGTASDLDTTGKVLFLEDLDEYLYHIDRMMQNLRRCGKLSQLAGLVIGGMSKMNDNTIPFGKTVEEIISEAVGDYDYPVCFGFPAGHEDDNRALILGRTIELKVGSNQSQVLFSNGFKDKSP